jgi:hypothetical protein
MNFRREPIRSRKLLDSAKGQTCTLEFVGVCNHDPETTVSCHIHDETFGMAMKADDTATVHGCSSCHVFMDQGGWIGKVSQTVMLRHILRAIFRTMRNRIERGLIVIPSDPERLSSERPVKPRKPRDERRKIPAGRPLESRSNLPPKGSRKFPHRRSEQT